MVVVAVVSLKRARYANVQGMRQALRNTQALLSSTFSSTPCCTAWLGKEVCVSVRARMAITDVRRGETRSAVVHVTTKAKPVRDRSKQFRST